MYTPDPAAENLDTAIARHAAHYSPQTSARLTALAHALPESQARELLAVVFAVHEETCAGCHAEEGTIRARVLAHVPGLTYVLEQTREHVMNDQHWQHPTCSHCATVPVPA